MKNFSVFFAKAALIVLISVALFMSCRDKPAPGALDRDTSYAFGMFMASQLKGPMGLELQFDYDAFLRGFKDFNEASETRLTMDQAYERITAFFLRLQAEDDERRLAEGERNREEGEAFLAANRARSGVITTASGLQYEVIRQGAGIRPTAADIVRVHYEGTLIDGSVFDSSYRRGEPVEFPLGHVIPGWVEGLQLMNEGSAFRLVIPSNLAYGSHGAPPAIPPNATLIFNVELLAVTRQ